MGYAAVLSPENKVRPPSPMNYADIAKQISEQAAVGTAPATERALASLANVGAPHEVLLFYRHHDLAECAEIKSSRLWPADDIVEENTRFVPGADLNPRGFFVVGTTCSGDAYCLDTRHASTGQVVLMAHELSWEGMTEQEIDGYTNTVAASFMEYLELFAKGFLPDEPHYTPRAA